MTAQIDDLFRYRRSLHSLAGISEGELFDISTLGLEPVPSCTACWRGYQAVFALSKSQLVLDTLRVSLYSEEEATVSDFGWNRAPVVGPVINGVSPTPGKGEYDIFNNQYRGLKHHLDYSGGLLLAKDFIESLYVHMGFHPAWKYETVIELIFKDGVLEEEFDRSDRVAEIRDLLTTSGDEPTLKDDPRPDGIVQFIERAFDRRYGVW